MPRVLFLHPDLGIGGAERLVVDAALALQKKGHQVHIVTSHHDENRCFTETRDGTVPVTVSGAWIPRSIWGHFHALCAYLRMMWAALWTVLSGAFEADAYFCDQVSACIPVLRLTRKPVLFFCHFPDLLLASHGGLIRQLYRAPLDWLEERTTGMASAIVVNSRFTAGVFHDTFKTLNNRPQVLYPSLNFVAFEGGDCGDLKSVIPGAESKFVFLSINRFERKKNIGLAISSFAESKLQSQAHLIIAGGYDTRLSENVEHFEELRLLCTKLDLDNSVTFLKSPNDDTKTLLLKKSHCLLYTPANEHFGIVPLEAMYCGLPVIAVSSGGPLETVQEPETGFLCSPIAEEFADKMQLLCRDRELAVQMGQRGRLRVRDHFSFESFGMQLDSLIKSLL